MKQIIIAKKGSLTDETVKKLEEDDRIVIQGKPSDFKIISHLYGDDMSMIQAIVKMAEYQFTKDDQSAIFKTILVNLTTKTAPK